MEYLAPNSLREALRLKNNTRKKRIYFAGGTILNWRSSPSADAIIDLKNLGLDDIKATKRTIRIGATATVQDIAETPGMPDVLIKAALSFSSINIRNMATIGGNVASRFFVSDLIPVFLAYNAKIEYYSNSRRHKVLMSSWLQTRPGIICAVIIDAPGRHVGSQAERIASTDFPLTVSAIGFSLQTGRIKNTVIAVSGAGPVTIILKKTAGYITGIFPGNVDHKILSDTLKAELKTIGNIKASSDIKFRLTYHSIKNIMSGLKKDLK